MLRDPFASRRRRLAGRGTRGRLSSSRSAAPVVFRVPSAPARFGFLAQQRPEILVRDARISHLLLVCFSYHRGVRRRRSRRSQGGLRWCGSATQAQEQRKLNPSRPLCALLCRVMVLTKQCAAPRSLPAAQERVTSVGATSADGTGARAEQQAAEALPAALSAADRLYHQARRTPASRRAASAKKHRRRRRPCHQLCDAPRRRPAAVSVHVVANLVHVPGEARPAA